MGEWIHLVDFWHFLPKEVIAVTSSLLFQSSKPLGEIGQIWKERNFSSEANILSFWSRHMDVFDKFASLAYISSSHKEDNLPPWKHDHLVPCPTPFVFDVSVNMVAMHTSQSSHWVFTQPANGNLSLQVLQPVRIMISLCV